MAPVAMTTVRVRSVSERGFCRAGRRFGPEPVDIEVDEKTLAILKAETKGLVVVEVPASAEATADKPADDGKDKDKDKGKGKGKDKDKDKGKQ